jgi:hypothetical protein
MGNKDAGHIELDAEAAEKIGKPRIIPRKTVSRTERHIRWNYEDSPDNPGRIRYHFVVVDDKDREETMNMARKGLTTASPNGHSIEPIKTAEGQVVNIIRNGLRYLYHSYDSEIEPKMLRLYEIPLPKIKDPRLKERKKGISITDYVERIYDFTMKP